MDNASLSELPLEARTLMAKMTLSHREIKQLLKVNAKKPDVYFTLKLKNRIKEAFIEANGRINYDNEIAFGNALHMCTEKAYGYGYEDALKQCSAIVRREIRKAAKGCISDDINKVICSFCGKTKEEVKKIVAGSTNVFICDECAELCAQLCVGEDDTVDNDYTIGKLTVPTPVEIHKKLNEYIIGQEDAKKSLSVAVYNHYKRIVFLEQSFESTIQKSNILILGQSGSGKTYLAQTMAKLLNVPFAIADATALTEAGYVGEDVETVLQKLIQAADGDVGQAERGIVFIDEIDKIARTAGTSSNRRDVGGESVQQALLKIIEGAVATVPLEGTHKDSKNKCVQLDTSNILFICGGAFDGIEKIIGQRTNNSVIGFSSRSDGTEIDVNGQVDTEDLQKFGLIPEIIGRLPVVVSLSPLDEDALVSILTEPKDAIIEQYKRLLKMDNVILEFTNDALAAIAEQAIARKIGARGLRTIIEGFMRDIMYEIPSKRGCVEKVIITKEVVVCGKAPEMIRRKDGVFND